MTISKEAHDFFHACETGQGWDACKTWCHDDATFSCQADALNDIRTMADYSEWMKNLFIPMPDARYELKSFAVDEKNNMMTAFAVFQGTHSGEGGPLPPTGKSVASDYAYVMKFDDGKIRHVTKIWNDAQAMRSLGWA